MKLIDFKTARDYNNLISSLTPNDRYVSDAYYVKYRDEDEKEDYEPIFFNSIDADPWDGDPEFYYRAPYYNELAEMMEERMGFHIEIDVFRCGAVKEYYPMIVSYDDSHPKDYDGMYWSGEPCKSHNDALISAVSYILKSHGNIALTNV